MLADYKLPVQFCNEAVNTAFYTLNRVLTLKKFKKTSYELLNNCKPNLKYLEPFMCLRTVLKKDAGKFDDNAFKGYFLGYISHKKPIFNIYSGCVEEWFHVDYQRLRVKPHLQPVKDPTRCSIMSHYLIRSHRRLKMYLKTWLEPIWNTNVFQNRVLLHTMRT